MAKRKYGEGSFDKTQSGKYRYRKRIQDEHGNGIRLTVTAKTQAECRRKMEEKERMHGVNEEKLTLAEALDLWAETFRKSEMSEQSYLRIRKTIKYISSPEKTDLGQYLFQKVTPKDIQKHLDRMNEEGKSASERVKHYSLLNQFYDYAWKKYRLQNPLGLVTKPTVRNTTAEPKPKECLMGDERDRFISVALSEREDNGTPLFRYGALIAANMYLGLRVGELIGLDWEDIDFDARRIYVHKTVVGNLRNQLQDNTKTRYNRTVPISNAAMDLLRKYAEGKELTGPVMITLGGKRPYEKQIYGNVNRILERAGIKDKSGTHILRKTAVKILFEAGVKEAVIAKIMGHSEAVMREIYLVIDDGDIENALKIIDSAE